METKAGIDVLSVLLYKKNWLQLSGLDGVRHLKEREREMLENGGLGSGAAGKRGL